MSGRERLKSADDGDGPQLRAAVDRLPEGIITITREHEIVYANAAARRLFRPARLDVASVLPDVWEEVSLADFVERLFQAGTETLTDEVRSESGRVYGVTGIGAGLADTAALIIDDATTLELGAVAQREFAANAAHELLTPLTGIVGAAHVLEAGAMAVPETRDRFISHIAGECDRLARIARALLVLARARSGEAPPRLERVPVRVLIHDAVQAAGIDSDFEVNCTPSLRVLTDHDLAEQALANLLANARRHGGQGTITIVAEELGDQRVEVRIADRGIGMFPEELVRLQRRFATTRTGPGGVGFGLGISIAAQALEMMDGTLSFESVPGEGTLACIGLPSARLEK